MNLTQINLHGHQHPDQALCPGDKSSFKFDMQTHHSIYNRERVFKYMHQDTTFVSTLRHPFDTLRSRYYGFGPKARIAEVEGDPIETFIKEASFNNKTKGYHSKRPNLINCMYNNPFVDNPHTPLSHKTIQLHLGKLRS